MSIRSKMIVGAGWSISSQLVVQALSFVSMIILARLLTPDDFGVVAIGLATQAVVGSLLVVTPGQALVRLRRIGRTHLNTAFTMTLIRAVGVGAILALSAWPLSLAYDDPRLVNIMLILGLATTTNGFANPATIFFDRELVFWQRFATQTSAKLMSLIVSATLAWLTGSYWALLLGSLAGQWVTILVSYIVKPYRPGFSLRRFSDIWGFSKNITVSAVIDTLSWRMDEFVIPAFSSPAMLGRYTMGTQISSMAVQNLTQPVISTLYPAFARIAHDRRALTTNYLKVVELVLSLSLPAGVGIALLAGPLVTLLLGPGWGPAAFVIQVVGPAAALMVASDISRTLAMSLGRTEEVSRLSVRQSMVRVPLILGGAFLGGFHGVVLARIFIVPNNLFQQQRMVHRLIGITVLQILGAISRTLLGVGLMIAAVIGARAALPALGLPPAEEHLAVTIGLALLGAATYALVRLVMWRLQGRPDGPETEAFALLGGLRSRFA